MKGPDLFAALCGMDADLEAAGFPPLTRWWRKELERFFSHPTALTAAYRVGRGGAKSTTAVKVATAMTIYGDFVVPKGERHYFAFVSENKDEAQGRLRLIEAYLDALGVPFRRSGDVIDLVEEPRGFRVLAARVGAVSGFRAYGWCSDETAKWKGEDGSNPADEVVTSLQAMTVTHEYARGMMISSPLGKLDYHAKTVDAGDTAHTIVATAPSWIANESLTEEQTKAKEPDRKKWLREYAAVPQASASSAFEFDEIGVCFRPQPRLVKSAPVLIVDPSSGGRDSFTWCVARWGLRMKEGAQVWWYYRSEVADQTFWHPGKPDGTRDDFLNSREGLCFRRCPPKRDDVDADSAVLIVEEVGGIDGKFSLAQSSKVYDLAATAADRYGAKHAYGDQREIAACHAHFGRRGIRYDSLPWTVESKRIAVETVRGWMAASKIVLPDHAQLRQQLAEYETKITASGYETFAGRGAHDDYAALLVTLAMVENARLLPHSPMHKGPPRGYVRFSPGM